jgi:hypothetical protein
MMNRDIRKPADDLAATDFRDAVIWLPELLLAQVQGGQSVIKDRSFTNCLLHGPAIFLAVRGVHLEGCNLGPCGGDIRTLVLRPASPKSVVGAIPFQDCRLIDCDFDSVGFTGAESFIESVLSVPQGAGS